MKFGPLPIDEALGAVLAHSLRLGTTRLKKGKRLEPRDIDALRASGINMVVVARIDAGEVAEDQAAERLATALAPDPAAQHLSRSAPFTGRANLYAECAGVLEVDERRVAALNALDDAVTLATLPAHTRVDARQMIATVKIIPYAAPGKAVEAAEALMAAAPVLRVHPVQTSSCHLILTRVPGMKESVLRKGADAVLARLTALGINGVTTSTVAHETDALADEIGRSSAQMLLILTGSATSDRADVGPAGLIAAGGHLERFGMPVDPGNLLFLGNVEDRQVIGLPGCARSPRLNGADWIIERVACGMEVRSQDIAMMGVGGLLKEISSRPEPRGGGAQAPKRPRIAAVLLAAGASTRMGARDKLLEDVDGTPLLRHVAERLAASAIDEVICVLRPNAAERAATLDGLDVRLLENPRAAEGMSTSVGSGVAALGRDVDGVLIVLADMPDVMPGDIDRLLSAFDPSEDRAIVRATTMLGVPGHPILFGRRFFEALTQLDGDKGARDLLREYRDFAVEVPIGGNAAITDLDTPEDWAAWGAGRAKSA